MDNSLDKIFVKYNINHPADFKGHSLSMSDIIVTIKDGKKQAFYCDQIGFQPVPGFFTQRTLTQHLGRSIK